MTIVGERRWSTAVGAPPGRGGVNGCLMVACRSLNGLASAYPHVAPVLDRMHSFVANASNDEHG
jgi:hypothetical protein